MVVFHSCWIDLRYAHKTMKNTRGEGGGGQAAPRRNTSKTHVPFRAEGVAAGRADGRPKDANTRPEWRNGRGNLKPRKTAPLSPNLDKLNNAHYDNPLGLDTAYLS